MSKVSFYPGPSQVYDKVPRWTKLAFDEGVLGINHRSRRFGEIVAEVYQLLQEKLQVPANYHVAFTSSATECWEIIAQSFVEEKTFHLYNGAFGEKWHRLYKPLVPTAVSYLFDFEAPLILDNVIVPSDVELLCLTHNETSNGTYLPDDQLRELRELYPDTLIALDATSSMAGQALDFSLGDIWFASVQKCFGLPAGMGILICSPAAHARALELQKRDHYNSWLTVQENAAKHQTHHTPNVLDIYLLSQMLRERKDIQKVHEKISERYRQWNEVIDQLAGVNHLVPDATIRSQTVLTLTASTSRIKALHQKAQQGGFTLGKGYGNWKKSSFRIANFPALRKEHIATLQRLLLEA